MCVAGRPVTAHRIQVGIDHFAHQIIERDLMMPAEFFLRLAGIANQRIHVRWSKISPVNFNQDAIFSNIDTLFCLT